MGDAETEKAIKCAYCGASGPVGSTRTWALTLWNRRAAQSEPADVAALRVELARVTEERDAARRVVRHAADALRAGNETEDAGQAATVAGKVEANLSAIAETYKQPTAARVGGRADPDTMD